MSAIICSEVFTAGIASWMSGPDRISPSDSSSASSHSPSSSPPSLSLFLSSPLGLLSSSSCSPGLPPSPHREGCGVLTLNRCSLQTELSAACGAAGSTAGDVELSPSDIHYIDHVQWTSSDSLAAHSLVAWMLLFSLNTTCNVGNSTTILRLRLSQRLLSISNRLYL